MRQKINRRFTGIALFSVVITTIVMTAVFYSQLKKQVFSDLAVVADLLTEEDSCEREIDNLRITLIDADGNVLFDSTVDGQSLANHLDRPEIAEAVSYGTGMGIRKSDTLSESVFYYAKKLDNGQILRVGKEAHSVVAVLSSALPMVLTTALLLAAICLMVSHYLTSAIVKPIDEMAVVGIAMGSMGSDAAIEAADVVLMDDDPGKIADIVRISGKTMGIVMQNIVFALGVKFVVLAMGAFGVANMWEAVFADVGVSVIAILNAMRALKA